MTFSCPALGSNQGSDPSTSSCFPLPIQNSSALGKSKTKQGANCLCGSSQQLRLFFPGASFFFPWFRGFFFGVFWGFLLSLQKDWIGFCVPMVSALHLPVGLDLSGFLWWISGLVGITSTGSKPRACRERGKEIACRLGETSEQF